MMFMKKAAAVVAAFSLMLSGIAAAESISFNGTVTGAKTVPVYATIGGAVEKVPVRAGEKVDSDTVLAELKTTKIYASEGGEITGLFAKLGDSAEQVISRYGALMYIEGDGLYTITASAAEAYKSVENSMIHVGEKVYLVSRSSESRSGTGKVIMVNGSNYTIEVNSGEFMVSEDVYVYRDSAHTYKERIGSGLISRRNPVAVSGTGSIVAVHVKNGQKVSRGDLLFETLSGTFDGYVMTGNSLCAGVSGIIASVNVGVGNMVQKDAVIATVYPEDAMQVEGMVAESNLNNIRVGDAVTMEFNHTDTIYRGVVQSVSYVPASAAGVESSYNVCISFTPDASIRYGMNLVVTTVN